MTPYLKEQWENRLVEDSQPPKNGPTKLRTRQLYWPINIDVEAENKYLDQLYEGKTYDYPFQSKPYKRSKHDGGSPKVTLPAIHVVLQEMEEKKSQGHIMPEQLRREETCYICQRTFVNRSNMKRHIKFTHMMQQAKHEQLVKSIEKTAGEKMSENQINCHIEYSKACHKLEQRMQVCQKRNPVMLQAEDKTVPTDADEPVDPLSVQEMKEL